MMVCAYVVSKLNFYTILFYFYLQRSVFDLFGWGWGGRVAPQVRGSVDQRPVEGRPSGLGGLRPWQWSVNGESKKINIHFLSNMSSVKTYVQKLDKLHYQWNKEVYYIRVLCNSTRVSNPDNKWEVRCQRIVSSVPRKLYWFCQQLWVTLGVPEAIPAWTNFCILPEILATLEKHLMGGQWDYIEFVRNSQRFLKKIDRTCLCYDCNADIWNYTFDRETSSFRHSAHFWWYIKSPSPPHFFWPFNALWS